MQTVVIIIHLMIVAVMIGAVLLQKSEGGGLGMGGGAGFMSSRGTANLLTRTTAILAVLRDQPVPVQAVATTAPSSITTGARPRRLAGGTPLNALTSGGSIAEEGRRAAGAQRPAGARSQKGRLRDAALASCIRNPIT